MSEPSAMDIKRGDVVQVDFEPVKGREIGKARPAVIIQNDVGNRVSPTTIVAAITDYSPGRAAYPFCIDVPRGTAGLRKRSLVNCAHIRTVDRVRIGKRVGSLPVDVMDETDTAIKVSLGLR